MQEEEPMRAGQIHLLEGQGMNGQRLKYTQDNGGKLLLKCYLEYRIRRSVKAIHLRANEELNKCLYPNL